MASEREPVERHVKRVSRREVLGTSAALGTAAIASGVSVQSVMAQSGGPTGEISGVVEDSNGPVENATVVSVPHDTSLSALETTTESDGTYLFDSGALHGGSNLYHVIARDGSETDPRRGVQNYPFIAAEGVDVPGSGLIHRYPATSGSGSVADSEGSNDLSLTGSTWVSGLGNGGYHINADGTDDQADGSAAPVTGSQNRTIACWINPDAVDQGAVGVSWGTDAAGELYSIWWSRASGSGGFGLTIAGDTDAVGLSASSGSWQLFGIILDGSTIGDHTYYLDGSTEAGSGSSSINTGTANPLRVTNGHGGINTNYWDGQWDDLAIWNRALTPSELDDYRDATKGNYGL